MITQSEPSQPALPQSAAESRCAYRFPSGPRCRNSVSPLHPQLCTAHLHYAGALAVSESPTEADANHPSPFDEALAADLLEAAGELTTAGDVNRVMRRTLQAMIERRLSPKEAGTLCYIAQTILQSHRAQAYEQKLKAEAERPRQKLSWNVPR